MSNDEDLSSGQLLRDIEEISQALYLQKGPPRALLSRTQYDSDCKGIMQDAIHKNKKSSIWRWNPLKTLTHIRSHQFNCLFLFHVHSIEGLASNFNDLILCVNWKRKGEVFRTQPVRVSQGMAEFEETLMHQCSVYVSRNGPQNSLKYEPKLFLLQASVVGAPTLDVGKHWVDLTRLLPLTLEELEEDKRTAGKWTTSFKLKGKAKGAMLNVSFGFSIPGDSSFDPSQFVKVSDNIEAGGHTTMHPSEDISLSNALHRLGSVSRQSSGKFQHVSSQSLDINFLHEVSSNQKSELAQSITFLYQKLDEGKFSYLYVSDSHHENLVPLDSKFAPLTETDFEDPGKDLEDIDFIVIDQGTELPVKDEVKHDCDYSQSAKKSISHTNDAEVLLEDLTTFCESGEPNSKDKVDFDNLFESATDSKYEVNDVRLTESSWDETQTVSCNFFDSESVELKPSLNVSQLFEQENNNMMPKPRQHGAGKMVRSLSVGDVTEFVTNEFLDMFGTDHNARDMNSDSDPESPRELLLREFEKECLDFGYLVTEQMEVKCFSRSGSGRVACSDDFDLSLAIQEAEKEHNRVTQSLRSRRNAKMVENLETETLMQKWGLNENFFQNSPQTISGGFGSPVYVPPVEPSVLPPLGEGLGPVVQTNGGGLLRSMSSSLFRRARNGAKLIMQVSNQVVLPAMMGSGVMDILQCWASGGAENMIIETIEVMPLPDITGKTMRQVSRESGCNAKVLNRNDKWDSTPDCKSSNHSLCMQKSIGDQSPVSGIILENLHSEYVSLKELVPLALANIEALSIEGLRIQAGLSHEEAPSSIRPQFSGNYTSKGVGVELDKVVGVSGGSESGRFDFKNKNNFNELMKLSLPLDDWVRLDALGVDCKGEVDGNMLKMLEAHNANFFDSDGEQPMSGSGCGLFGNSFTLALRLQLRDPFRDYEIVGDPMLALIQVEKIYIPPPEEMINGSTETNLSNKQADLCESTSFQENYKKMNPQVIPFFKISQVHISGLNLVPNDRQVLITGKQKQSGARWFLSSGMNKISKRPFSRSQAIIKHSSELLGKQAGDILWSISSHVQHSTKWTELAELNFHVRNPDILLPGGRVRSLEA